MALAVPIGSTVKSLVVVNLPAVGSFQHLRCEMVLRICHLLCLASVGQDYWLKLACRVNGLAAINHEVGITGQANDDFSQIALTAPADVALTAALSQSACRSFTSTEP